MVSTPPTACSSPSPVIRSPSYVPGRPLRLKTLLPTPALSNRSTPRRPSPPVPPVTRTSGALTAGPPLFQPDPSAARHRASPGRRRGGWSGLRLLVLVSSVPAGLRYEDGLQARQSVDALGVLARPVGGHLRLPLPPGRFDELLARTDQVHERHPEPARARHPIHRDVYDGPRPGQVGQAGTQPIVRLIIGFVDRAPTVEAHHPRRVIEGAEHQRDAAIRPEVGYRLHAATREVQPGDAVRIQDPEGAEPARRDVDVGRRVYGGGGHEEDRLSLDPGEQLVGYLLECLRHRATPSASLRRPSHVRQHPPRLL